MFTKIGTEIKIGCDPEFFLYDTVDKMHVSAHTMIPGDKRNPFVVPHGAIQVDGTAVEFNIDAASSPEEFESNVKSVLEYLRKTIDPRYEFQFKPAIKYDKKYFNDLPAITKELGCEPDYNAHTGMVNPRPPADKVGTLRTGSGHIHIGWTKDKDINDPHHIWDCQQLVKALDSYFAQYSHFWDNDTQRTKLYGNYGAYRPKPYGVEYRVLSNAWLKYPQLYQWIVKSCLFIFEQLQSGRHCNYGNEPKISILSTLFNRHKNSHDFFFNYHACSPFYYSKLLLPVIEGYTPAFTEVKYPQTKHFRTW